MRYKRDGQSEALFATGQPARRAFGSDPTTWGEWSRKMATAQLTPAGVGIHNVLIATDFSQCSNTALTFGLQLARSFQAEAHVVSVVASDAFMLAGPEAYIAARDAASRDLKELQEELRTRHSYIEGKDYHLLMLEGEVAQSILDFAVPEEG